MNATEQNTELSGTDPDVDEKALWRRVEAETQALIEPLARMVNRKDMVFHLGVSEGQISRELSEAYDNRLSLSLGLYVLRHTQHDRFAQLLICDAAGYRLPEPQKRKVTEADELRAFKEACRDAGIAGQAIAEDAKRRARRSAR